MPRASRRGVVAGSGIVLARTPQKGKGQVKAYLAASTAIRDASARGRTRRGAGRHGGGASRARPGARGAAGGGDPLLEPQAGGPRRVPPHLRGAVPAPAAAL